MIQALNVFRDCPAPLEEYHVVFEPNGSYGTAFTLSIDQPFTLILPDIVNSDFTFSRPGYGLNYWSLAQNGSGRYNVGDVFEVNAETTGQQFFTQWSLGGV